MVESPVASPALTLVCEAGRERPSEPITLPPCLLFGIQGHTTTTYNESGIKGQELGLLFQDAFQSCHYSERVGAVDCSVQAPHPGIDWKTG